MSSSFFGAPCSVGFRCGSAVGTGGGVDDGDGTAARARRFFHHSENVSRAGVEVGGTIDAGGSTGAVGTDLGVCGAVFGRTGRTTAASSSGDEYSTRPFTGRRCRGAGRASSGNKLISPMEWFSEFHA